MLKNVHILSKNGLFDKIGRLQQLIRHASAETKISPLIDSAVESVESSYPPVKPEFPPGDWGDIPRTYAWHLHKQAGECLEVKTAQKRLEHLAQMAKGYPVTLQPVSTYCDKPRTNEFKQYITNTHIIEGLPGTYNQEVSSDVMSTISSAVEETLIEEHVSKYKLKLHGNKNRLYKGDEAHVNDHDLYGRIVTQITSLLSASSPELYFSQMDEYVRCEAFWRRNGYEDMEIKSKTKWLGMLSFQYLGELDWQVRNEIPLQQVMELNYILC